MIEALLILKKYWFLGVIVALVFVVLIDHARIADKEKALVAREAQVADLTKSNEDAALVINRQAQSRIDNDAIASAINSKLKVNVTRETNTRTIIESAGDGNPAIHTWLSQTDPSVVRNSLSAN